MKNYCLKQLVKALCLTCAGLAKYVAGGWYPRRGDGTCCHDVKRHLCVPCEGASICFLSTHQHYTNTSHTVSTLCLKGHLEGHGGCGGAYCPKSDPPTLRTLCLGGHKGCGGAYCPESSPPTSASHTVLQRSWRLWWLQLSQIVSTNTSFTVSRRS